MFQGITVDTSAQPVLLLRKAETVGYNTGHCAVRRLVGSNIFQPFGKKVVHIHIKSCRARKYLRVARPAQALIALRAIGRYIQGNCLFVPIEYYAAVG